MTYPENIHRVVGHHDTAETNQTRTENDRVHDCGKVFVRCVGCDGLADGRVQELVENHLQVDLTGDAGVIGESCCVVPAHEVQSRADDQIGDLGGDLGSDKGEPVIGF